MTTSTQSLFLCNAKIVLPNCVVVNRAIQIEGQRITRVLDSDAAPFADSVLDLAGCTLFPGFIDMHMHGAVGVDTMTASADELLRVSEFLARHGVTGWLPTLVPSSLQQYKQAIRAIEVAIRTQDLSE